MRRLLVRTAALVAITLLVAQGAKAETNVLFIFDVSGSTKKTLATGETRFAVAQRAMAQALAGMPPDVRLGLLLYGHRKSKDCTDIELVSPIGADDQAAIAATIGSLKPRGETPIADALVKAIRNFAAFKDQSNRIVLITDGIEECGGDPCAAAQAVVAAGLDLKVDVVGFTLTEQQARTIQCIADTTGGRYYDARDVASLTQALTQVAETAAAPQAPARLNLLDPKEGGQLLVAPGDGWLASNDGVPDYNGWLGVEGEGVYAFRDERPATFDTFTVYVPGTNSVDLKEFELLVGDEGPTGPFRSIGTFATQNVKMIKNPYQEFTFPPVTGRYLKVRALVSHGGGDSATTEFQLFGELGESGASAAPAAMPPSAMINLLDPKQGGQLLVALGDGWLASNDGVPDYNGWLGVEGEGVYAFRDERPATFDRFTVYVPQTNGVNLKEFELLVGDEGPTGAFRPIGTFTTHNVKMVKNPYQEFTFPPVTGRYLKVKALSSHAGGDSAVTEFQLFGELGEGGAPTAPAAAPASATINLLDPRQGGQLLVAPGDGWLASNDGIPDYNGWLGVEGEGVYAFRDERPATFNRFAVYIPGTNSVNLKEFELLVGDDGPTGSFRSIGAFATQNVKMVQNTSQEFTFPPVTGRYLKVKAVSSHGGGDSATTEFQLFGELGQ